MRLPGIPQRLRPPWAFMAIVRHRVRQQARKATLFACLALALLLACWILYRIWPDYPMSYSDTVTSGKFFAHYTGTFLLFALFAIVPSITAQSLVEERLKNTYDLLKLTPITPSGIIAGILTSALAVYLFLAIAFLPLLALQTFAFPFDLAPLKLPLLLFPICALSCGIGAVAVSASAPDSRHASQRAMAWSAFCLFGYAVLPYLGALVYSQRTQDPAILLGFGRTLLYTSPAVLCLSYAWTPVPPASVASSVAIQAFFATVAYLVARRAISRPSQVIAATASESGEPPSSISKALRASSRTHRRKRGPIPDYWNPVLLHELRHGKLLENVTPLKRMIVVLALALSNMAFLGVLLTNRELQRFSAVSQYYVLGWLGMLSVVAIVSAIPMTAPAFTKETEGETKDQLQLTLVSPSQLLFGKVLGGAYHALLGMGLVALSNLPLFALVAAQPVLWPVLAAGTVTTLVCVLTVSTISAYVSLHAQATSSAIALSLLVTLAYALSPLLLFGMRAIAYGYMSRQPYALLISPVLGAFGFVRHTPEIGIRFVPWLAHTMLHTVALLFLLQIAKRALGQRWFRELPGLPNTTRGN